jgi:uncharacterized protein YgiB involved in biofilm formation
MKRSRSARLVLMGLSPLVLAGCQQKQEAVLYQSVDECVAGGELDAAQCQAAYDGARREAESNSPRYLSRADCVADFGEAQCGTAPHSQGFFMPLMTGFLLARALDGRTLAPQPLYRPRNGEWTTAGGYNVGRQTGRVSVDPAAAQPQRASTQTRAGFGARAAARGGAGG